MDAPSLRELLDCLRSYLAREMPGECPEQLKIRLASGRKLKIDVPPGVPPERPPPSPIDEAPLTECETDIVRLLEERGERLTGDAIKSEFARQRRVHSEGTVNRSLARLVHEKGRLTNRRDSYGRGYGLRDWS